MKKLAFLFLSLAASSLITACGQVRAGAIGEAKDEIADIDDADPNDPFGHCYFIGPPEGYDWETTPVETFYFWMKPSSPEAFNCNGRSSSNYVTQECVTTVTPVFACETDADCPQPISGTAEATCNRSYCVLKCNNGETCPDGLTCDDTWSKDHVTKAPLATCMSVVEHPCFYH